MDLFSGSEKAMGMTGRVWARHGNPLSVYSRLFSTTLVFLGLWSPFWIGWLGVPIIVAVGFWVWFNPRLFPPPRTANAWATKGVLGERVFINRKRIAIPEGHLARWLDHLFACRHFSFSLHLGVYSR